MIGKPDLGGLTDSTIRAALHRIIGYSGLFRYILMRPPDGCAPLTGACKMSRLVDKLAGDHRRDVAYQELYLTRPASEIQPDNYGLYTAAARTIGPDQPITYLEFGVAGGNSISSIAKLFTHGESRFIGFDSFVSLPEAWLFHGRGAFGQAGLLPALSDPRVQFVKGWFQNTLHAAMAKQSSSLQKNVLIHFDADLYSSTLFVLCSLWPMIDQYYFIMDDFMQDDIVALYDFCLAYPVELTFIARHEGGLPHSVLGHMRRKAFDP